MAASRVSFVPGDVTLLDTVTLGAASSAARAGLRGAAVLFLAVLTAAAAQVSVHLPFTPVPLTLQPVIVLVGGAALGARLGAMSQVVYLLLGVAGLQVFAASALLPPGVARLLGPTGGYLMAYPFAAFVTGWLARGGCDRRYLTSALAMLAGLVVLFLGGVSWLAFLMPGAAGLQVALATGLYPFVAVDLAKIAVASAIMPGIWMLMGRLSLRD